MPSNIELSDIEMSIVNAKSREFTILTYINKAKKQYDCVFIDCMPSFGMITVNSLADADNVNIPVQAHYHPDKEHDKAHQDHFKSTYADQSQIAD